MPLAEVWIKALVYLGLVCGWTEGARPRFDTSTDMGLVLVPADAEVDSVIFRLRATDQDADFPLVFEVTATITPVVRIDNLPCTLYNKVCQANVILTKRLIPGRLHDFAVRVRDSKGDSNSMQATISATNATTSRDKIFPHIPSLIMVPEDTKPGKELDYILVRANPWSGKPVYIELWQPKELFTIRQRQTPTQTRGVIMLNGELDFETQSMYTLTVYATDPYTEPAKDTRNIAGLNIVVVVQDVQDVPPIFTSAPPLTRLNNSVQTGDVILRVHAEDGDKGVPRDIVYGLVSESNPFVTFFNISETTGEVVLARPLEELTQITHVGAPVVLSVVAEEIRRSRDEPPAQATVVEVGFLLGEPGNSPPYFENDKYIASIPENLEPGTVVTFPEQYATTVHDEDIGKAGVFALKLRNNNGTFEINPAVAERIANFIITIRDNALIDYEMHKSLSFKIVAQEVGPATNLSASAEAVIFIQDVNDNLPVFDEESYEVTLSENVTAGTRVIQVHATDEDTGLFGSIKYTGITGQGSDAFAIDPDTGLITVAMGSSLDREMAAQLRLTVQARDENGRGNTGAAPLIVNLLDVNDNAPIFERDVYEFALNSDLTNFTTPAIIKAIDADAEPPNNEIHYELIHGNYEDKFYLNEITGELTLRSPITKYRRKKQSVYDNFVKTHKASLHPEHAIRETATITTISSNAVNSTKNISSENELKRQVDEIKKHRRRRAESDILYTLTARAYDLGVPHLSSETKVLIVRGTAMEARIMMFVVPGERPNLAKTVETLATITAGRVTVLDTRPYVANNRTGISGTTMPPGEKRTVVVARVEQTEPGVPLVDVEKIRNTLAANGVGIIGGMSTNINMTYNGGSATKSTPIDGIVHDGKDNKTISSVHEEVTVYKAENKLLFWLLIILGLLMLLAIVALIVCCICPGCPFYMAPRKRRVYSSEALVARADGRPRRHVHRKPMPSIEITSNGKKQAWSADPTRRNWYFNRRNAKNGGLASLPGDVVFISERPPIPPIEQPTVESLRLRDGPPYDSSRRRKMEGQERMYVEDVDERKIRDYEDEDSLQRHEVERGSDILRQAYRQRYVEPEIHDEPAIREQHFYREGNAEVLQLLTRGQAEDNGSTHRRHYPTTLIVDGKEVLLQRFIQDQKARHEQEPEAARTIESHQRPKHLYQQEVLLLPGDLEIRHRHAEELESNGQKAATDDGVYETRKVDAESQARRQEVSINVIPAAEISLPMIAKEQTMQSYALHDLELARQNVLLTRLLLEREPRHAGGAMLDAASYLETQSLPGQVAIATQTERAAATQTERQGRSRSDNESDEDSRKRRRMKTKKRERESRRIRALWMKSPLPEEKESPCFEKRLNILKRKAREVKDGRKTSLQPEVLREISDSLGEEREGKIHRKSSEESSFAYKILGEEKNGSSSPSTGVGKRRYERVYDEIIYDERRGDIWSSPDISAGNNMRSICETTEKSSKKESKTKRHKKVESVIRPSFRVLEREITMLTKRLSKRLADKKVQRVAVDEYTKQEKSRTSKGIKKDSDRGAPKKTESTSKERKTSSPSTSKETTIAKTRQKLKYQRKFMSPGNSEYDDDALEKSKKSGSRKETPKKTSSHVSRTRVKKQMQAQVERKEHKRQEQEAEKRRDVESKESGKPELKAEKPAKVSSRAQKLAAIGRRGNVVEEPSTSDRINDKKDPFVARESDERSGEGTSSNHVDRRKPKQKLDHVSEKFSDEFSKQQREDVDQSEVLRSLIACERHMMRDDARDIKIIQQFSDDFVTETETTDVEGPAEVPAVSEGMSETEHSARHAFEKEHVTMKEAAEEIKDFQTLGYMQLKSESDTAMEQPTELLETSRVEQLNGNNDIHVDLALEEYRMEKPTSYADKTAEEIKEEMTHVHEKHEEEIPKPSYQIQEEIIEKMEIAKGLEDVKDVTDLSHLNGGDEGVELHEAEDSEEKLSHELKERFKEEILLAESAIDIERRVVEQIKEEKELKLETEAFQMISDISKSEIDSTNLIDIHRVSSADERDEILTSVDETTQELAGDASMQTESKIIDIMKEEVDKVEHFADLSTEVEIESREAEEQSDVGTHESPGLEDSTLSEADEKKSLASLTEATVEQKVTDGEVLRVEHTKTTKEEEESLREELEEGREESFKPKEESDETTEGARDEGSIDDRSSKDSTLVESAVGKSDTAEKSETVAVSANDAADPQDRGEQRADVSVPIFTSFIDTLGMSEESDSSSDISRKTTLTARPYDTPRHRRQQESPEMAETLATKVSDDETGATVAIEPEEDTSSNLSLDEIESTEDSVAGDEREDRAEITAAFERVLSDDEKALSVLRSTKVEDGVTEDAGSDSKFEAKDAKAPVADVSTAVRAVVPLVLSIEETSGASGRNVEDESVSTTGKERTGKSATRYEERIGEMQGAIEPSSEHVRRADATEEGETKTGIAAAGDTRSKDAQVDEAMSKGEPPSSPKKHVARIESYESYIQTRRKLERSKVPSPWQRKRAPDDESEERAAPARFRRPPQRQTRDGGEARKQSRSEEEDRQRVQTLPRTRSRKPAVAPRGGEIDTSKTQSKYMAWYNKKREEAERKRLEREAVEDEEQLPRWVSRSLRCQATRQRHGAVRRTPEATPRVRRKIKPLVNVESEQLKAIVRQGRQLRRAEGVAPEDPTIEIFAGTPPIPAADARHPLLQHSEYKYERVPPPFYLHPPPAPHPSPQLSPQRSFEPQPSTSRCVQTEDESAARVARYIATTFQSPRPLRHQHLLEKKSVFDIAYSEAAPSQLRSDSTTPSS